MRRAEEERRGEGECATSANTIHNASRHTETKKKRARFEENRPTTGKRQVPLSSLWAFILQLRTCGRIPRILGRESVSAFLNYPPCAPS